MKIIAKTKAILICNKAETIAEALVAFLVLSIVMVLFAQGMRFATAAEKFAIDNTKTYDNAFLELQKTIAGDASGKASRKEHYPVALTGTDSELHLSSYSVEVGEGDTDTYIYWVFDAE